MLDTVIGVPLNGLQHNNLMLSDKEWHGILLDFFFFFFVLCGNSQQLKLWGCHFLAHLYNQLGQISNMAPTLPQQHLQCYCQRLHSL